MRRLALVLALASAVVLAGQPASAISLGGIRNSLIQWVLDKVSIEGVFEIEVEEVIGAEEQGTSLLGVEIADAEGVWFTADRLTFDFNRTRLLRGQLFVENLELEGVEMFRQPVIPAGEEIEVNLEGTEAPPEPEFYWPRSPITTAIQRLAMQDVFLHEEVLGQAIRFDATGSFGDQGDVQSAALELRRTDEVQGVIDLDYRRDFAADTLTLNLDAVEAPGGIVSALSGLPQDVPVRVTAHAEGTPDDFETTFDLALTDFLEAQGTATIDYSGPLSVDAQFTARPGPLMPEDYAQLLGEQAELVVQASEGPDQTVQIETARIDSPYLNATVSGTYGRETGAVDARIELVAEPGLAAPFEGVEFAGLRFQGNVQGQPGSLSADGELVLQGFTTEQLAVESATLEIEVGQSGPADAATTELTAEGLVTGLRLDKVGPDVIGEARIVLDASMTGDEVLLETARIDSDALDISASGTANIATWDFEIDFDADAPELAPILAAYGIDGDGAIDAEGRVVSQGGVTTLTTAADLTAFDSDFVEAGRLHLEGTVVQSPDRTTFDLTGTGEELGIDEVGPDLIDRADLALSGILEGDVLTLETARLTSPVLDATAEGRVNTADMTGQVGFSVVSGNLAEIADAYGFDLQGALEAEGAVTLTPEGMSLTTTADATGLEGDIETDRLHVEAEVDQAGERTAFLVTANSDRLSIELEGQELAGPVDLAVQGAMVGNELTLDSARIASPIVQASAEGTLNLEDFSGTLTYDVEEARLSVLAPLVGAEATGVLSARGTAGLTGAGDDAAPGVEGTAAVQDLTVYGMEIGDLAAIYDLAMAEAPEGTLRLELTDSPYAPPDAPTVLALEMAGPPSAWNLDFDLDAPDYLEAEGTATVAYEGPLSVSAEVAVRPGPALPEEWTQLIGDEATLVVEAAEGEDQTIRIDTARISSPLLNATVNGTYATDTGAADLDIQLVAEPGLAAPFEGVEFDGLRFDGTVQGQPGSLTATGDLVLDGFASDQLAVGRAVLDIDVGQTGTAEAPTTTIDVAGTIDGLRIAGIGPEVIGQARLALDASLTGDVLAIDAASIDSELLQLRAEGTANIATMAFDVTYAAEAPTLAPLLDAYGIDGAGALDATGRAVGDGDETTLTTSADLTGFVSDFAEAARLHLDGTVAQAGERTSFDLTGFGEELSVAGIGPDLLDRAELALSGALEGDVLTLDAARIDSPVLDALAEGRLNLATETGQVDFRLASDTLAPVADAYGFDLQGALAATGTATLTPEGLSLTATADATGLAGDIEAERLHLDAQVDQAGERTAFTVTGSSDRLGIELAGEELSGPVDLAVEGALVGDELTLDTARVSSPIIDATIDGALNLGDLTGRFAYDVAEARLAALSPVLGVEATGLLSAEGVADLTGEAVAAEGTAAVQDLSVYGTAIGDLAATYDMALADVPEGTLRLELTDSPYAPDAPTVFALEMGGPPDAWALDFDLSAPNYLQADGSATVNWEGPLSVDASVSARPGPALPQEWAQLIGEEATLVVRAAEGEDRTVRIDTARLSSPVLNAQVSGTYSLATGAADLDLDLEAEPELAAPFEGVEFDGLRFDGAVTGEPGSLTADGDLVLQGFSSEQIAVESAVLEMDIGQTGTAEAPTTEIDLAGTASGLRVAQIGPELVGDARLALDASLTGDVLTIDTARIDSPLLQLWAEGTANVSTMEFDLDYNLATPAIAPLAEALLGMEAEGAVTAAGQVTSQEDGLALETRAELTNFRSDYADAERLQVEGTVAQEGDRTAFDLAGSGQGLRVDQIGPDLLGDAQFTAEGVLDGNELALDTLRITSPVIEATAQGAVNLETGEGRLEYAASDVALGALAPLYELPVSGTAAAEGVLGLAAGTAADGPRLVGEARIADLVYAGTTVGDLRLTHDVVLSETPHGTLDAALTGGPYAPATVEAAFRLDGQRLVLDDFDARAFGVTAGGDLVVNLDTMGAEGALTLRATEGPFAPAEATVQLRMEGDRLVLDDLRARAFGLAAAGDISVNLDTLLAEGTLRIDEADLSALVGAPVAGDAQGTVRLSGERGQQVATVDLAVTGLTAAGVTIGQAQVQGRIADVLGTPRVDLTMAAERVVSGDLRLAVANLTAQGPLSGFDIALRGQGELDDAPLTIAAAARADLAGAATRVTVGQLDLAIGDDRISVLAPLTVVSRGSALLVEDMAIALPDNGRLTGDIAWHGGPLAGDILLDAPDISFMSRLFDVPVEAGALRVAGTFDTRRGSAGAALTVAGREIVVADVAGASAMSIDASLDWDGRILDLDARVGGFEEPLVVRASVPVRPTAGFPELAESGPVSASVRWQGEIGNLWALVPMPGHVLTGEARIDIGVTGDISSPRFTGGILLADGVYQNLDYGTILTGISLATTIESTGALAMRLDAVDGAQGNVRVEGTIGLGEQGIDLTVETRRAVVVRRDDAIVRVDADLRIFQQPEQMVVAGEVNILEAEVRLLLDNPPTIVTLGEVRIKGQPIVEEEEALALPIALQIDVNSPGRIFVRGRGLDSEWMIDLDVRGTISEPRLTGEVSAVRGGLDLLGRDFDLERGRVLFGGGPEIDPRLDVSLVRETDDITGRIVISGTASDPELSLTSTPALPESEILPRLLFGTASEALTPAQGVQLALGLATLLNGGGGTLDQVRAGLGLDTLGIGQDDEGAALEVGKQVTEDVWVGTRQSLEGGGTSVAVEVEVFRNIEAYGEVSTGGETSVGFEWKKDF